MEVYEYHSNITQKWHGASINYRYVLDVSRVNCHPSPGAQDRSWVSRLSVCPVYLSFLTCGFHYSFNLFSMPNPSKKAKLNKPMAEKTTAEPEEDPEAAHTLDRKSVV